MSLQLQLDAIKENFLKVDPAITTPLLSAKADIKATYDPSSAIQVGEKFPPATLSDALGKEVNINDLLAQGPLLITFYRGEWCPFCNLFLRTLQLHLDQFKAKGVTLVAISPELPNQSLSTVEKNELKFPVLSDVGNKLAKQLGIAWKQPDAIRPIFEKIGHDLKTRNGDDSFVVPIPSTFLVDQRGVVRNAFVEPDFAQRLEPSTALEWIDAL